MAALLFAMALVVTSGAPEFDIEVVWYALAALIVVALARLGDHLLFGPMSASRPPPRGAPPGGWTRFRVRV